ncbi:unnamed protein product [marine sediment metagenome]|uniref:Uncharacterized protein n=1 Tax=marine sediment metagenome TaxID=412755 RepID=X1FIR9_9ZZZZ
MANSAPVGSSGPTGQAEGKGHRAWRIAQEQRAERKGHGARRMAHSAKGMHSSAP